MTHEFQLDDVVIFTGELVDPKPAYAAMDVFVLPSAQPEPFGGVVMEAMAMSLPVIGTDLGGSSDQVVPDKTGWLIMPGDANALAAKIEMLVRDQSLRERMGCAGRKRIGTEFNLNKMVRTLENIYESNLPTFKRD